MKTKVKEIRKKTAKKVKEILLSGSSAEKLALSVVMGFLVGIIPLFGAVTGIAAAFAFGLRLNMAAIQLVQLVVNPIQMILFVPFLKLSQLFFNVPEFSLSAREMMSLLRTDFLGTLQDFWMVNLGGLAVWFVVCIPTGIIMYYFLAKSFKKLQLAYIKRH